MATAVMLVSLSFTFSQYPYPVCPLSLSRVTNTLPLTEYRHRPVCGHQPLRTGGASGGDRRNQSDAQQEQPLHISGSLPVFAAVY